MIGLLGATGYTGRLVVDELARRGLPARLGARDSGRLTSLLSHVPRDAGFEPWIVDVTNRTKLDGFLSGLDAVISCVGPYVQYGDAVVDAAVRAAVPYVDCSGEPEFVAGVLRRHDAAHVAVVPACGFDGLIGDLAAAVAAEHFGGPVDRVVIGYRVSGGSASQGTVRSALAGTGGGGGRRRPLRVRFPEGRRWALPVSFVDEVLIPHHVPGADVTTALALPAGFGVVGLSLMRRFADKLERFVVRLPEGPPLARRLRLSFTIVAEASGPHTHSTVVCRGRDSYGLTARFLVEAVTRLRAARPGANPAAIALPPAAFLDAVSGDDFHWTFDHPEPGLERM